VTGKGKGGTAEGDTLKSIEDLFGSKFMTSWSATRRTTSSTARTATTRSRAAAAPTR
jgi:hypothetical protein